MPTDAYSCMICRSPLLTEIPEFSSLPRVTSDCVAFRSGEGSSFVLAVVPLNPPPIRNGSPRSRKSMPVIAPITRREARNNRCANRAREH